MPAGSGGPRASSWGTPAGDRGQRGPGYGRQDSYRGEAPHGRLLAAGKRRSGIESETWCENTLTPPNDARPFGVARMLAPPSGLKSPAPKGIAAKAPGRLV